MRRLRDFPFTALLSIPFSLMLLGPQVMRTFMGANDFVGFYAAGTLATSSNLYEIQGFMHQQGVSAGLISDQILFVRFPWQAVFFTPFTLLPYFTARLVWAGVCVLALCLFFACFPKVPANARILVICWSLPVFMALDVGQDVPLVLAAVGGAFFLMNREKYLLAGLVLSLGMAKPHLLWPLALALVWHRMWRVCAGGAIGCAVLTGISFLAAGKDWIARCMQVMRYADLTAKVELMPTLHSALLHTPNRQVIEIALTVILLAAILRGQTWKESAAIALAVGILLGRHAFMADCALLLPALFLVWNQSRARTVLLLLASPLTYVAGILINPVLVVAAFGIGAISLAVVREPAENPSSSAVGVLA